jgi:hypothetical protein
MHAKTIIPPVEAFSKISSDQISVVVQGPVIRDSIGGRSTTTLCLQSIRQHLPQAEIILSTWGGADVSDLDNIDKLVTSPDPGGIWNPVKHRYNNVNRMITSTAAGLAVASREYCLKFRTDLHLTSDRICRLDLTPTANSNSRLFSVPMTITSFYVRNPAVIPMLFHPSDIVQFSRTKDLLDFWNQPLVDPTWLVRQSGPVMSIFGRYAGFTPLRLVPEQVVTVQWLIRQGIQVSATDIFDVELKSFRLWSHVLFENFRIIDANESGVHFYPRLQRKKFFTDAANFNEESYRRSALQQSDWQIRVHWLEALFSKYVRCFFYPRYYTRLIRTYRLYRAWRREENTEK